MGGGGGWEQLAFLGSRPGERGDAAEEEELFRHGLLWELEGGLEPDRGLS